MFMAKKCGFSVVSAHWVVSGTAARDAQRPAKTTLCRLNLRRIHQEPPAKHF
jgi:hypothetical protein